MSWIELERQVLTGTAASITLGNGGTLNQTYKTLKVVVSARNNYSGGGAANFHLKFNATTTGYTDRFLQGNGSAASSNYNLSGTLGIYCGPVENNAWTASTFDSREITIPNYAGSANKPISVDATTENNTTGSYLHLAAGLLSNTTAITSITITPEASTGDLLANTTVTLYGLK